MESEQWKGIPGFPGYDVSDRGRIRSYYARGQGRGRGRLKWGLTDHPQRVLKPGATKQGYKMVNLCRDGFVCPMKVQRAVLLAFVGECPDGMEICHNDGNPRNNKLSNLRYDTHANNIAEATGMGYRLDESTVVAIRTARANGAPLLRIAADYGMAEGRVGAICRGQSYKAYGGPIIYNPNPKKLTEREVIAIRRKYAAGDSLSQIAAEYGRDQSGISLIVNGKRYAHVGGPIKGQW